MNEKRIIWNSTRAILESDRYKRKKSGKKSKSHWSLFQKLLNYFVILLKATGYYEKGVSNAKNILIKNIDLFFGQLSDEFEDFKILHLTDLHLDTYPGIEEKIICIIQQTDYDLCVITGDYRKSTHGRYRQILPALKKIIDNIQAEMGIVGILGNHDTHLMLTHLENMGVKMLINESIKLKRKNAHITITGTDDPYYYFTENAIDALEEPIKGFKIALVHSSELFDIAADNKYDLYLCGHTHGGQICLPSGKPLITHQFEGKQFYRGLWKYKNMQGYTSPGCGVSAIPIRFNCPGEITVFTLKQKRDASEKKN